jgi:hypothetical protein
MLRIKSGFPSGSPECIELRIGDQKSLRRPFNPKNRLHWPYPEPGLDLRMKTDNSLGIDYPVFFGLSWPQGIE